MHKTLLVVPLVNTHRDPPFDAGREMRKICVCIPPPHDFEHNNSNDDDVFTKVPLQFTGTAAAAPANKREDSNRNTSRKTEEKEKNPDIHKNIRHAFVLHGSVTMVPFAKAQLRPPLLALDVTMYLCFIKPPPQLLEQLAVSLTYFAMHG